MPITGILIYRALRPDGEHDRRQRSSRGQSLPEFALVVSLLLMILLGIVETGRLCNTWLVVANGAREGARTAAVGASTDEIVTAVRAVTPTLQQSQLSIQIQNAQGDAGEPVIVQIGYPFTFSTPLIGNLFPSNPYNLSSQVTMRLE